MTTRVLKNKNAVASADSARSAEQLRTLLERTSTKLHQTELLLSVTRKISGLKNLSDILWALIQMTTEELGAERGSLFLNDPITGELYTRIAQGELTREIRILNNTGIAGAVFQSGVSEIIHNAYEDDRFHFCDSNGQHHAHHPVPRHW